MKIYIKGLNEDKNISPRFVQWDIGQKVYISGWNYDKSKYETPVFHFGNRNNKVIIADVATEYTTGDGEQILEGNVPDDLLREPYPINVYIYLSEKQKVNNPDPAESDFVKNYKSDPTVATPSKTVFIATIDVEPRLPTDNSEALENLTDSGITLTELISEFNEHKENYTGHLAKEVETYATNDNLKKTNDSITTLSNKLDDSNNEINKRVTKDELSQILAGGYRLVVSDTIPSGDTVSEEKIITIVVGTVNK